MAKANHYGLILAGGRGTRFWPRSRSRHAKQVLQIFGGSTMIQSTVSRLAPAIEAERMWVLTSGDLRREVVSQLPGIPTRQILAEPVPRNTAPAIGVAAHLLASIDPDAVMGVFPSDHVVLNPARFLRVVRAAFKAAAAGKIVTLGIPPRHPETGFGYVELPKGATPGSLDPYPVASFREKPDLATAKKYVKAGRFYWNSGMFFWKAQVFLDALRQHLPKTATLLSSLPPVASKRFPAAFAEVFPLCESISVDYAVLEKADNVVALACEDFGWSDAGSWSAVYDLLDKDPDANAGRGTMITLDARGNYVDVENKLVALVGVENLIVVDTPDALLVVPRDQAQRVGELVKMLEKHKRADLL